MNADDGAGAVNIDITINGVKTTISAHLARNDLTAVLGSPYHAFSFTMPTLAPGTATLLVEAVSTASGARTTLRSGIADLNPAPDFFHILMPPAAPPSPAGRWIPTAPIRSISVSISMAWWAHRSSPIEIASMSQPFITSTTPALPPPVILPAMWWRFSRSIHLPEWPPRFIPTITRPSGVWAR